MIALCVAIVCVSLLIAQHFDHKHKHQTTADTGRLEEINKRLAALEGKEAKAFDQAAFDDLKSKVEALRIAQGMRSRG